MRLERLAVVLLASLLAVSARAADQGNRLMYLDEFCNPYWVGQGMPKLVTPQWIGEPGVEAVIVLSIDDMSEPARYEKFLRPILERLKKIDGRGPVSIMTKAGDVRGPQFQVQEPQLQAWLKEGLSIETHTATHPCPCLQGNDLARSKDTFDRCIDHLWQIPNMTPVAFRMPCCDSMNSMSPRFFVEIFNRTTPAGHFVRLDSSVFMLFTPDDPQLPRAVVFEEGDRQRFTKYIPQNKGFVNYVRDYPYPYVIDRLCWELPSPIPDDWQGINLQGPYHRDTVRDMKAGIDATVVKQGEFTLTHHPGSWIKNDQVIELIDHAVGRYGRKVKFLNLREVHERLTANLLGGHPLRAADGGDNGVRVVDVNHDGYMDAIIGNDQVRQTRVWSPAAGRWEVSDFPVPLVAVDKAGQRTATGVRFGVLRKDASASILMRNETVSGVWHFTGGRWVSDPQGLAGLAVEGPVFTSRGGRDCGVRLCDLDGDGVCELLVGNPRQTAVFRWRVAGGGWERLPFGLPADTVFVDAEGRDAGLRLVDADVDTHLDVVFSNAERYGCWRFTSLETGWAQTMISGRRGEGKDIPPIIRADGTNNGVWFKDNYIWVQNEQTGKKLPNEVDRRPMTDLLGTDRS